MQKVASQVDELKTRLLERTTEFNRIRSLHVRSAKESFELKQRVQEMARQNELEKQELQRTILLPLSIDGTKIKFSCFDVHVKLLVVLSFDFRIVRNQALHNL